MSKRVLIMKGVLRMDDKVRSYNSETGKITVMTREEFDKSIQEDFGSPKGRTIKCLKCHHVSKPKDHPDLLTDKKYWWDYSCPNCRELITLA